MINSATKYSISEVFSPDIDIKYVIPKYQRQYIWNRDNWEELINDILESEGGHFIGSLICVNKGLDAFQVSALELIDGQQRLTTISILYAAIYKLLSVNADSSDEDLKYELQNLKMRLVLRSNRNEPKISLSMENNNFLDYKSILKEISIIEFNQEVANKGNRRIYKAFRFFVAKLENYSKQELLNLINAINKVLVVKIEVNTHSDAFMLFESLNNRGVPLSAVDLIKNKLLAELENIEGITIGEAFDKWRKIIEYLPEYSIQERFLRQFYNAFKHRKEIKVDSAVKATRSNLIKIYETLIERDPKKIFNVLYDASLIYHDLIIPEDSNRIIFEELDKDLTDIINVQAAPAYAFLLYLFSVDEKEVSFYKKIINLLVKYFIRRNVTDFPNTRNLDKIFIDLIEEIALDKEKINYDYISSFLNKEDKISSLLIFREKLDSDIYEMNIEATRFILSKIEESRQTARETFIDFWKRDRNDKLIWTIEHIFPEGRNIPSSWVDMVADGDRNKAVEIQEKYVHRLGNLTLTGYNQNLSNFDFKKKRDRTDRQGNPIGYKNKLFLNEFLKNKDKWTIEDIVERNKKLIDLTIEIFKMDNEK
jgi:uncharacterized protein with ParB-like and HNH nuclease domain